MPTDKMASDNEACVTDPNFAIICSFFNKFGKICGVIHPNIQELQVMLENTLEVHPALIDLHIRLLRKARRTVHSDKWERALVKFMHSYSSQDAWNVERFGYKKTKPTERLIILKNLLELQFDTNTKFKTIVTQSTAQELRLEPIGRDRRGNAYWYQVDEDCNMRVYKEDLDEEIWELVAQNREQLSELITKLDCNNDSSNNTISNEDSNSMATISSLLTAKANEDSKIENGNSKSDVEKPLDEKNKPDEDSEEFLSPDEEDENYFNDQIVNDNAKDGIIVKTQKTVDSISNPEPEGHKGSVDSENKIEESEKDTNKRKRSNSVDKEVIQESKKTKVDDEKDQHSDKTNDLNEGDDLEIGEAIEEPILYVSGQGAGADCDAVNPGESENSDKNIASDDIKNPAEKLTDTDVAGVSSIKGHTSNCLDKTGEKINEMDSQIGQSEIQKTELISDICDEKLDGTIDGDANKSVEPDTDSRKEILLDEQIEQNDSELNKDTVDEVSVKNTETKPLMFFGQPGCLKLNPVMVKTAGHTSFFNSSFNKDMVQNDTEEKLVNISEIGDSEKECDNDLEEEDKLENLIFNNDEDIIRTSINTEDDQENLINITNFINETSEDCNKKSEPLDNKFFPNNSSQPISLDKNDSILTETASVTDISLNESFEEKSQNMNASNLILYEVTSLNLSNKSVDNSLIISDKNESKTLTTDSSIILGQSNEKRLSLENLDDNSSSNSVISRSSDILQETDLMKVLGTDNSLSEENVNESCSTNLDITENLSEISEENKSEIKTSKVEDTKADLESKSILSDENLPKETENLEEEFQNTKSMPEPQEQEIFSSEQAMNISSNNYEICKLVEDQIFEEKRMEMNVDSEVESTNSNLCSSECVSKQEEDISSSSNSENLDSATSNIVDSSSSVEEETKKLVNVEVLENVMPIEELSEKASENQINISKSEDKLEAPITILDDSGNSSDKIMKSDDTLINQSDNKKEEVEIIENQNVEENIEKEEIKNLVDQIENIETLSKVDLSLNTNIEIDSSTKDIVTGSEKLILEDSLGNGQDSFSKSEEKPDTLVEEKSIAEKIMDDSENSSSLFTDVDILSEPENKTDTEEVIENLENDGLEICPSSEIKDDSSETKEDMNILDKSEIKNNELIVHNQNVEDLSTINESNKNLDDIKSSVDSKIALDEKPSLENVGVEILEKEEIELNEESAETKPQNSGSEDTDPSLDEISSEEFENIDVPEKSMEDIPSSSGKILEDVNPCSENNSEDSSGLSSSSLINEIPENDEVSDPKSLLVDSIEEVSKIEDFTKQSELQDTTKELIDLKNEDKKLVDETEMVSLTMTDEDTSKLVLESEDSKKEVEMESNLSKEIITADLVNSDFKENVDLLKKELINIEQTPFVSEELDTSKETIVDDITINQNLENENLEPKDGSEDLMTDFEKPKLDSEKTDICDKNAIVSEKISELTLINGDLNEECGKLISKFPENVDTLQIDLITVSNVQADDEPCPKKFKTSDFEKDIDSGIKNLNIKDDLQKLTEKNTSSDVNISACTSKSNEVKIVLDEIFDRVEIKTADEMKIPQKSTEENFENVLNESENLDSTKESIGEIEKVQSKNQDSIEESELISEVTAENTNLKTETLENNEISEDVVLKVSKSKIEDFSKSYKSLDVENSTKEEIIQVEKVFEKSQTLEKIDSSVEEKFENLGNIEVPEIYTEDISSSEKSFSDDENVDSISDDTNSVEEQKLIENQGIDNKTEDIHKIDEDIIDNTKTTDSEDLNINMDDVKISENITTEKLYINIEPVCSKSAEINLEEPKILSDVNLVDEEIALEESILVEKVDSEKKCENELLDTPKTSDVDNLKTVDENVTDISDSEESVEDLSTDNKNLDEIGLKSHVINEDMRVVENISIVEKVDSVKIEEDICKSGENSKTISETENEIKLDDKSEIRIEKDEIKDNNDKDVKSEDTLITEKTDTTDNIDNMLDNKPDNVNEDEIELDKIKSVEEFKNDKQIQSISEIKLDDQNISEDDLSKDQIESDKTKSEQETKDNTETSQSKPEIKIDDTNISGKKIGPYDQKLEDESKTEDLSSSEEEEEEDDQDQSNEDFENPEIIHTITKNSLLEKRIKNSLLLNTIIDDSITKIIDYSKEEDTSHDEFPCDENISDDDSILDDDDNQEDPLADPLAGTHEIDQGNDKEEKLNVDGQNSGTIKVKQISDLKLSAGAGAGGGNTRKRRISVKIEDSLESAEVSSEEECGGKRIKMRGKKVDSNLRQNTEHKKRKQKVGASSSEEEEDEDEEEEIKNKNKNAKKAATKKSKERDVSKEDQDKIDTKEDNSGSKKPRKKTRRIMGLLVDETAIISKSDECNVRQSRRIAQLKIREEAERRKVEEITLTQLKQHATSQHHQEGKKQRKSKHDADDAEFKVEKRKRKQKSESSEESDEESSRDTQDKKKKKKQGRKKKAPTLPAFDESRPWRSSSESSSSKDEEEDFEHEHYSEDEHTAVLKSDHEFSPESDLEGEVQPTRRARTVKKDTEEDIESCNYDEHRCQHCGKSDHPQWILLCDSCDCGYHCSCLKPVLLVIPEGDWHCPPCQQKRLITNLQTQLVEYDKLVKKKELEDLRKQRLAYVGISTENVIPDDGEKKIKEQANREAESSSGSEGSSSSGSDSEEDEGGYKLRERRVNNVSYRFNDYDDLINSAIKDEMDEVKGAGNMGRGKDISTIIDAEKEERKEADRIAKENAKETEEGEEPAPKSGSEYDEKGDKNSGKSSDDSDSEPINPVLSKLIKQKKKTRKLNALDVSSEEDHVSDEDFKGSSPDSEDEELESNSDLSDSELDLPRKKGATRRSTRARTSRFDKTFIDDGSSSSDAPKRKKKFRGILSDEESLTSSSEDSDTGWKSKKKRTPAKKSKVARPKMPQIKSDNSGSPKKRKKRRTGELPDLLFRSGGLAKKQPGDQDDNQEEGADTAGGGRRTRGRKINYVEALASDSDDDKKKKKRTPIKRVVSEDEYNPTAEEPSEEINPSEITPKPSENPTDTLNSSVEETVNKKPKTEEKLTPAKSPRGRKPGAGRKPKNPNLVDDLPKELQVENTSAVVANVSTMSGKPSPMTLSKLQNKVVGNKNYTISPGPTHRRPMPTIKMPGGSIAGRIPVPKMAKMEGQGEDLEGEEEEEDDESLDEEEDDEELDDDELDEEEDEEFQPGLDHTEEPESEERLAQLMMEDPDFAQARLQQVAAQIARDKRKKAAEQKKLEKEQKRLDRARKKDEKIRLKEEKAKEREEKKLAKQAALAAMVATPVERKKPGRKPKALLQNQGLVEQSLQPGVGARVPGISPQGGLYQHLTGTQPVNLNPLSGKPGHITASNALSMMAKSAAQPLKSPMMNPVPGSDSRVMSPLVSGGPISPCTSSSMSNASAPGGASGMSPVPQNFGLSPGRHPLQHPMMAGLPQGQRPAQGYPGMTGVQQDFGPSAPKRRGRGRGKKALAAEAARGSKDDDNKILPGQNAPGVSNLSVAAPPQPFSASQPAPSVITRMLLNPGAGPGGSPGPNHPGATQPGQAQGYPGAGLPQGPPGSKYYGHHDPHAQFMQQRAPRPPGQPGVMYRPPGPMTGYPPRGMYHPHSHDPSPSGGGPINLPPSAAGPPPPLRPGTPPGKNPAVNQVRPPYDFQQGNTVRHQMGPGVQPPYHQPYPGYHGQGYHGQPGPYQFEPGTQPPPIHQGPQPGHPGHPGTQSLHPGAPQPIHSAPQPILSMPQSINTLPPSQPGMVPDDPNFEGPGPGSVNRFEPENDQDEESGEFGGLVSYFSSQREDDLDT